MKQTVFFVAKMDCPTEEQIIRNRFKTMTGVDRLDFNLMQRELTVTHRLDDDKTRVTAQLDIDPEGFVENVADKAGILDRKIKGDMGRFKEFIESLGSATGSWRGDVERPGA